MEIGRDRKGLKGIRRDKTCNEGLQGYGETTTC